MDMPQPTCFPVKLNHVGAVTVSEKTYALQAPLVARSEASLIDH